MARHKTLSAQTCTTRLRMQCVQCGGATVQVTVSCEQDGISGGAEHSGAEALQLIRTWPNFVTTHDPLCSENISDELD